MEKTILLVDDNTNLLRALAELLRGCGYSVLEHADPGKALECFCRNAEINCVLTDIDMPAMDGISLVTALRRIRPGVQVVFMTGGPRGIEASGQVLHKPFTLGELIDAVENVGHLSRDDDIEGESSVA